MKESNLRLNAIISTDFRENQILRLLTEVITQKVLTNVPDYTKNIREITSYITLRQVNIVKCMGDVTRRYLITSFPFTTRQIQNNRA